MRRLGLIVAIVIVAVDVLYIWYIRFVQAGPPSDLPWRVPFVAAYLALMAIFAALSTRVAPRWRAALMGACAVGLLVLGFLAMFSIGVPVFVSGLLAFASLVQTITNSAGRRIAVAASMAGALAALVVLFVGFEVTERIIGCPPGVISGGSGGGFLTGPYSYTCQNGRAIITYGG